jgi:hypothetical protein
MIPCSWKESFGIECPSCGAQRSFLELMHGHLLESIVLFPALLPLIAVGIITIIHIIHPLKKGPYWIVRLFALSAVLMFGNWIFKLV